MLSDENQTDIELEQEIKEFFALFNKYAKLSRTPGEMANASDISDIRRAVSGPRGAENQFSAQLSSDGSSKTIPSSEKVYFSQIDSARQLLHNGKPNGAKEILNVLKTSLKQITVSKELLFKIDTNLGASEMALGNNEQAIQYFENAFIHAPTHFKAMANKALAYLLRHSYQSASELAKRVIDEGKETGQTCAPSVYVHTEAELRFYKDFENLLGRSFFSNPDYLRAMGSIYLDLRKSL